MNAVAPALFLNVPMIFRITIASRRPRSPRLFVASIPGVPKNVSHHGIPFLRYVIAFSTAASPLSPYRFSRLLSARFPWLSRRTRARRLAVSKPRVSFS